MHPFHNRTISISEFLSCVTSGARLCQSCSVLQNDSSHDFHHLNNVSIRTNICLNFSKAHKRKQTSLLAKVNSGFLFSFFPVTMLVSLRTAPEWRLHTKLYKFVWNIMSNNSSTETRTDLRLCHQFIDLLLMFHEKYRFPESERVSKPNSTTTLRTK